MKVYLRAAAGLMWAYALMELLREFKPVFPSSGPVSAFVLLGVLAWRESYRCDQ